MAHSADQHVHVLHVVRTLGRGGMERNLTRVVLALEPRGFRHSILLLHHQQDIVALPLHIPLHRVITPPHDPRMTLGIRRLIARIRPSVIHARNWGAWPDTAFARMLTVPRVPLIFSYHGMEGSTVPKVLRLKFQAMERLTTRIFAVSDAARRLLVEAYGLSLDRIGVISNGVDTSVFSPNAGPRARRSGRLVVGAIGRVSRIKNLPLLVRACHRLIEGGHDLELWIVGDGADQLRVRELGASLGMDERVKMLGHVKDVVPVLHEVDVFVLSSDNEANPNSLLEAMSCALPCVSTEVGNIGEVLDGGRCGLLVPRDDERAMADAIARFLEDESLRRSFGLAARRRVVERYGQSRMFDAYEELYRNPKTTTLD